MQPEASAEITSLTRTDIAAIVIAYVAEFFFVEEATIQESSRFEEDLCADAFSFTDCVDALEEEFTDRALGFSLDIKEREELESVKDLVDIITRYTLEGPKR